MTLFFLGVGLLAVTMFTGLVAYRVREYETVPRTRYLIDKHSVKSYTEVLRTIAVEMSKATEINSRLNETKLHL